MGLPIPPEEMEHSESQAESKSQRLEPIRSLTFLDLPPEIREVIYSYTVISKNHIRPDFEYYNRQGQVVVFDEHSPVTSSGLLTVNRQISHEAIAVLKSNNVGIFGDLYHRKVFNRHTREDLVSYLDSIWKRDARLAGQDPEDADSLVYSKCRAEDSKRYGEHCLFRIQARQNGMRADMVAHLDSIHIWVDWFNRNSWLSPNHTKYYLQELAMLMGPLYKCLLAGGPNVRKTIKVLF